MGCTWLWFLVFLLAGMVTGGLGTGFLVTFLSMETELLWASWIA